MNTNELAQEPHERLVEVLLEEEFRRARMVSPRRQNSRWLAAAFVLLGLSVVGGVMLLKSPDATAERPAQTPQDPRGYVGPLFKADELKSLFPQVKRVRLAFVPHVGTPTSIMLEAVTTIDDPKRLSEFLSLIPALADGGPSFAGAPNWNPHPDPRWYPQPASPWAAQWTNSLQLELADGRRVVSLLRLDEHPAFVVAGMPPAVLTPGPFLDQVNELCAEALANHRIAHGDAQSFLELARVPATATSIRCPHPPRGFVAMHLGRFEQLERLHLELTWNLSDKTLTIQGTAPLRFDEFSALRRLRHFQFPGNGLVDADAAALARTPNLTSVRIDGGLGDLSEIGARTLVQNLDALELVGVRNAEVVLRAAIAAGRLRKLALARIDPPPGHFAPLLAALVAMPTLVELDLGPGPWSDFDIATLLKAKAPLVCLRMQCTDATTRGLCSLVLLPSLRELDLRGAKLQPEALAEIAKALPNCRIRRPGEQPEPTFPYVPAATRR